ncbi:hypothetical protein HYPSUDRAFT_78266 [Hypholoma sublateritium FD-334 SS-4]|uniref:Uncharacterized protein n=1 Tax=Hypholoma sublateritium (strain FD-334 SS-4) TaxID=945553 RepID=A0A0D2NVK7_HYPSF|nr:hypothetical protein HYPSUDRAFT_78266 [Hypholoma sublateritium FD-334 SS-4]
MATAVERPLGALPSQGSHQHQQLSNIIEIIDVDSYEEIPATSQRRNPAPRPRGRNEPSNQEFISILDSDDDEVEIVASRIRSGHDADRNQSHRRFISPAPRDPSAPPPVPSVPRRYTGLTSFPMRQQQSHPPVIPIAEPLAFERASMPPVAGPSNPNTRIIPERGAPPSHHSPAMGLGGALISSNRSQAVQRQREIDLTAATAVRRRQRGPVAMYRSSGRFISPFTVTDRDDDVYIHMMLHPFMAEDMDHIPHGWHRHHHHPPKDEQYRKSYTHPVPSEPGFTYDFTALSAEASTPGSSASTSKAESIGSGQLNALLVCAKCLDPLVLNSALVPEEAQFKRVWALRCGHLIDEKCLNILGQPSAEEITPDKKGKGKARAPARRSGCGSALPEQASLDSAVAAVAFPTDMRSRLRSRRSGGATAAGPMLPVEGDGAVGVNVPVPSPPAKKRRAVQRKPKVEAEFEWSCPVASCGRIHVSVRIEGVWGPEKEMPTPRSVGKAGAAWTEPRGAIAVFA